MVTEGGTIDWKQTMALLRPCAAQFPLLLELKERAEYSSPLESAGQVFDRLESQ